MTVKKAKIFLTMFLAVFFIFGCSTLTNQSYQTLFTFGQMYDAGMKLVSSSQKQGKVSIVQREEINKLATDYYNNYQFAVTTLQMYKKVPNSNTEKTLTDALKKVAVSYSVLATGANSIQPGLFVIQEVK